MSKGNPVIKFRCPKDVLAEIQAEVDRTINNNEPHTVSSWLLKAAKEKLRHCKAGRKRNHSSQVAGKPNSVVDSTSEATAGDAPPPTQTGQTGQQETES